MTTENVKTNGWPKQTSSSLTVLRFDSHPPTCREGINYL
jgi:hypothetical protein